MSKQENRKNYSFPKELEDEWRPIKELDRGGQGIPLLCEKISSKEQIPHRNTEQAVLKILKEGSNDYELERMKREIRVLNEIDHPNVVKPIQCDDSAHPRWYLIPYGTPLKAMWRDYRKEHEGDPIAMFTKSGQIIRSLLLGLQQFHVRDYVHRDIKPGNVIFSSSDEPLLIDLGIVYHPEFEPITFDKGAGNRFVLISSAVSASPYVDCLCMASLWAWLLSKDHNVSYGHYHWKYVELLGDDWRYEIVRATLANCSHELPSPKDADQMLKMLDASYSLELLVDEGAFSETEIQEALVAQIEATTQTDLKKVDHRDRIESVAAIAIKPLELVRINLRNAIENMQEKGIKISFSDFPIIGSTHKDDQDNGYFSQFLDKPPRTDVRFFSIGGGIGGDRGYNATLNIHFGDQQNEDELGLVITWALDSRRNNSGSSSKRQFFLTKRLTFKAVTHTETSEYNPAELTSLLLNDLTSRMKSL